MPITRYKRSDVRIIIRSEGSQVVARVETDWASLERRAEADSPRLREALRIDAPVADALDALGPGSETDLRRVTIDLREPRWAGIDWRGIVRPDVPLSAPILHVTAARPRVLDIPLTFPVPRVLQIGGGYGTPREGSMLGGWCALDDVRSYMERKQWATAEVLHFRDLADRVPADRLLRTSRPEEPGTVGWLSRIADLWQTRLIIIESDWAAGPMDALRRAAHLVVRRGGPAVWLIERDAPLLRDVYESIVHSRPFDWIAAQAPEAPALLFAGAGREEALRFLPIRPIAPGAALSPASDDTALQKSAAPAAPQTTKRLARDVNSAFFLANERGGLERGDPRRDRLPTDRALHLGIWIGGSEKGAVSVGSVALFEEAFRWTEQSKGAWIEIGVTPLDFDLLGDPIQELWLPADGESGRITFPLQARSDTLIPGVARVRFTIYYQNNCVQSFRVAALLAGYDGGDGAAVLARALDADPAEVADATYAMRTEYECARLADVAHMPRRNLAILANDLAGQKVATFKADDLFAVTVDANLTPKVEAARRALKNASANAADEYRYVQSNRGTADDLRAVLYDVAAAGWSLYSSLLPNADDRKALEGALATESVVHAAHVDLSKVVPWSLVYDRKIDPRHTRHYVDPLNPAAGSYAVKQALCEATLPGPDGKIPDAVCGEDSKCPLNRDELKRMQLQGETRCFESVVCPRHFWGFRHNIEVPVQQTHGSGPPKPVKMEVAASKPTEVFAAFNRNLARANEHEKSLRGAVAGARRPAALREPIAAERDLVQQTLDLIQPDVVYFYCHAHPAKAEKNGAEVPPRLDFGQDTAADVMTAVDFDGGSWAHGPLVFLNGCATVGFSPAAPSEFITRFVQGRNAAAVIGTEVTIWEMLADEMAVEVLREFLSGIAAGDALLAARRKLLAKYNPLGLAYTLYGSAALHLN